MKQGGPNYSDLYNRQSSNLIGYIKKSLVNLGGWAPVTGSLVKISSGGGSHVWGIGNNSSIFVCKEPCNGSWKKIDIPDQDILSVYDIATNNNSAFVLYERKGIEPASKSQATELKKNEEPAVTFKKTSNLAVICQKLGFDDWVIQNIVKDDPIMALMLTTMIQQSQEQHLMSVKADPNFYVNLDKVVSEVKKKCTVPTFAETIKSTLDEDQVWIVTYWPCYLLAILDDKRVTNGGNMQPNAVQRSLEASPTAAAAISYYFENSTTKESFDRLNAPFVQAATAAASPAKSSSTQGIKNSYRLGIVNIDGSGKWDIQNLPVKASRIIIYQNKIMISSEEDNSVGECVIPCATGTWNFVPKGGDDIMSGSADNFYVKRNNTNKYFRCGSFGKCSTVRGLDGLDLTSLAAENDNNMLYAADSKNVYKCLKQECNSKEDVRKVDVRGMLALQDRGALSANPSTQGLWFISNTPESHGNLYQRIDVQNTDPIIEKVDDELKEAERLYNSLGGGTESQTYKVSSKLARKEAADAIKGTLDISEKLNETDNELNILKRKIETTKSGSSKYTQNMKLLHILFLTLLITLCLFLFGGRVIPPEFLMLSVVVVLGCGLGMAYYFSSYNK